MVVFDLPGTASEATIDDRVPRHEIAECHRLPPLPHLAAAESFTVGTARAERHAATGMIEVRAGDAATSIPVIVVHGSRPGKVLAIVSGAHGTNTPRSSRSRS
jgi:hypothetical protein